MPTTSLLSPKTQPRLPNGRFASNKPANNKNKTNRAKKTKAPAILRTPMLINHIALAIDDSGSMGGLPVVRVVDELLKKFAQTDKESKNQKTLVTLVSFGDPSEVKIHCIDTEASALGSIGDWYRADDCSTALTDGAMKSIETLQQVRESIGDDHSYLVYVITDGGENSSYNVKYSLASLVKQVSANDNWTVAFMVPNVYGKSQVMAHYAVPAGNIEIWDTTSVRGIETMGATVSQSYASYSTARSHGVRGSNQLFTLDTSKLTRKALEPVDQREYALATVDRDKTVTEAFHDFFGPKAWFVSGRVFYQPTKKVKIQSYKKIYVQDIKSGKVYEGGDLRTLLGLPAQSVEVNPNDFSNGWRIFVQSTSNNRNLFAGTRILLALK